MSRRKPMRYGFVPALSLLAAAGLVLGVSSAFGGTCERHAERAREMATIYHSGEPFSSVMAQAQNLREMVIVSRLAIGPKHTNPAGTQRAAERVARREKWLCQRVALQRASAP